MEFEVEVVLPNVCGAFYKASIETLNIDSSTAVVSFENDWQPSTTVQLACVRYPPKETTAVESSLANGSQVEAYLPHKEGEEPGWWIGKIAKNKGELYVVEFNDGHSTYTDILEKEKLRPPNKNPPLSDLEFSSRHYSIPVEIQDYCKMPGVHQKFREKIGALLVSYDSAQQQLIVVASNQKCIDKANLLIDLHFKNLRTMYMLQAHNQEAQQKIQESQKQKQHPTGKFVEEVYVPQSLLGIAIGSGGNNVGAARNVTGIISIDLDDSTSTFTIVGDSKQAVSEAREMLEYTVETISIPREYAGKVIGKKGNTIQGIMEKSRVLNVKIMGDDEAKKKNVDTKDKVPFVFTGLKSSVENAKLMLEYHMEHLKTIEQLVEDREQLDQQLRQLQIPRSSNYFPAPGRGGLRQSQPSSNRPGGRGYGNAGWERGATANGPLQKGDENSDPHSDEESSQEEESAFSREEDNDEEDDEEGEDDKTPETPLSVTTQSNATRGRYNRGRGNQRGRFRGRGYRNTGNSNQRFSNRGGGGGGRGNYRGRNPRQSYSSNNPRSNQFEKKADQDNSVEPSQEDIHEEQTEQEVMQSVNLPKDQRPPRERRTVPLDTTSSNPTSELQQEDSLAVKDQPPTTVDEAD